MAASTPERYAAIERDYSQGHWHQVLEASNALLTELKDSDAGDLRCRLWLLQAHTHRHGLADPAGAAALYQRVLDAGPEAVLGAIAAQELARCQAPQPQPEPQPEAPIPTGNAMPWLADLKDLQPGPLPRPLPTPLVAEVLEEPEQIDVAQADPSRAEVVDLALAKPAIESVPKPAAQPDPEPTPIAQDALSPSEWAELAAGLLLVRLQPEP
jgi:hypothetical protein